MKKKKTVQGFVATAEQTVKWEKDHGRYHRFQIGDKACYLRPPKRQDVDMVSSTSSGYLSGRELLLDNLWLDGDEEIKTDEDYFFNIAPRLDEMIPSLMVDIKKNWKPAP